MRVCQFRHIRIFRRVFFILPGWTLGVNLASPRGPVVCYPAIVFARIRLARGCTVIAWL